ncbi:MAG: LacI family DNA-binding transcriptional regulator [Salinibacter sp.]
MSVTIQDVADHADVSVATVSRVLNESDRVREETKTKVRAAAQSLGYHPNETARNLRAQQTRMIGVLLPNMHGEFFAQVTRGLDRRARASGHHLLVSNSHTQEDEARSVIRSLLGRVDGLILLWPRLSHDFLGDLVPDDLPVVLLNTDRSGPRFETLAFGNRDGAYAAVEHLAEHGHERIAFLGGGAQNFDARERRRGYRAAVADHDLVADPSLELEGDFTRAAGREAVDELLARSPRPTALFAANDSMALGVLRGLHDAGLEAPDDLALVGFDDIPMAHYVAPSLTTVHAPMQELGERAVERLLALVKGEAAPSHQTLQTRLVRRESCGCTPDA